jgi:hypothetical protein
VIERSKIIEESRYRYRPNCVSESSVASCIWAGQASACRAMPDVTMLFDYRCVDADCAIDR